MTAKIVRDETPVSPCDAQTSALCCKGQSRIFWNASSMCLSVITFYLILASRSLSRTDISRMGCTMPQRKRPVLVPSEESS